MKLDGLVLLGALTLYSCAPAMSTTSPSISPESPAHQFFENLRQHCGNAYAGRLTVARPDRMDLTGDEGMIVDFRDCSDGELRLPFHIERPAKSDWDRSRTWIFTRHVRTLELRHDHRHEDGTSSEETMYGGFTQSPGTAQRQEFILADRVADDGAILGWRVEIEPGVRYTYGTIRGDAWTWRVDFDLTHPISRPPAPWGH
jgi:hypothetical protein